MELTTSINTPLWSPDVLLEREEHEFVEEKAKVEYQSDESQQSCDEVEVFSIHNLRAGWVVYIEGVPPGGGCKIVVLVELWLERRVCWHS